ncbi:hypothetical protein BDF20DRAFT_982257 [Mycotypha africana]|uniref:uncharacterized protein n=1 Tax=Mycotypha africana TaxID=64632 RepID=UPI0023008394|nr:uncharacterized protein BDF20DRAFT_982257 [Mycotypha africana]KAI8967702.1 hypothetical protein BDF20DRAFT_982257 [Mycotypha africana]
MTTLQANDRSGESSQIVPNVKLSEARTAVLLDKHVLPNNRSELTMWVLEHIFQPVTTMQQYNGYQLLHLSASSKPCWERKKKEATQPSQPSTATNDTPADPTDSVNAPFRITTISSPDKDNKSVEKMYLITPRTRILTIKKEHCMVFMIDLSSSLATIETSTGKVMLGNAFSVLENVIQGLVQPYTINLSDNAAPFTVETNIRITVIAECSQFGSNINVIPILAEYPTLRVLMQNISVSNDNVADVLKSLRDSIDNFKRDLSKFRKQLKSKRAKMGYELDVREDHTQSVTEGVEPAFTRSSSRQELDNSAISTILKEEEQGSVLRNSPSTFSISPQPAQSQSQSQSQSQVQQRHRRSRSITSKQPFKKLEATSSSSSPRKSLTNSPASQHRHHKCSPSLNNNNNNTSHNASYSNHSKHPAIKDKKDTWGVGKTGSTLSYILRAGLLALSVLSKNEQSSIFLLTDGVVKSNVQDETVIRQLTAENIWCNVIQLGQENAFFPGLNFGFVPDNEILEFLASSTLGHFTYAEHCPTVKLTTTASDENTGGETSTNSNRRLSPNVYHQRYLLKEVNFDYINHFRLHRKNRENGSSGQTHSSEKELNVMNSTMALESTTFDSVPHYGRRAFPWDPLAKPVLEELGRLKFKEYFLPTECWHFMRARLRQGFILQSVSFIDETKASHSNNKPAATNSSLHRTQQLLTAEGMPTPQKKQYVIMIFILRWQPSITVQYSIKALWTSSLRYHLKSLSASLENSYSLPMETPPPFNNEKFLDCIKSPKVEIVIKSTSTFAHMLHNWDSFQRRTQMMAVQGGNATVDLASAPGFIKVGKMKRFLERLAETDSMLKQLVQFSITEKGNASLLQQQHPEKDDLNASVGIELQQYSSYVQKFSSHWAKLERSDLRPFNSSWYDESGFNAVLAESSTPAVALTSDSPVDYHNNELSPSLLSVTDINRDAVKAAFSQIQSNLKKWSTFMSEDQQVFIKVANIKQLSALRKDGSNNSNEVVNDKHTYNVQLTNGSAKRYTVPQFCEIRLIRETERLLYVKLMFFNTNTLQRNEIESEVKNLLLSSGTSSHSQEIHMQSQEISPAANASPIYKNNYSMNAGIMVHITKRPLSTLLMRDASHHTAFTIADMDAAKNSSQSLRSLWISNPAMFLTGEFIVKNYLQHCTWYWDVQDIQQDQYGFAQAFTPIMDLALDHIVVARLRERWTLLSITRSTAHFYIETDSGESEMQSTYSAQYFIWKDPQKKRLTTELWIEPMSDKKTYKMHESVKKETFTTDKRIISQLITFDTIYSFGHNYSASIDDTLAVRMDDEDESRISTVWMHRSLLFDLSSIFRIGSFSFALYALPNYDRHFHPEATGPIIDDHPLHNDQYKMLAGEVIRQRNELVFGTTDLHHHSRQTLCSDLHDLSTLCKSPAIYQTDANLTCVCLRPDSLFASEKNNISKLTPTLRDIALLHYYVEQSLSNITDRTMPLTKVSMDDFWPSLIKELFQNASINGNESTTSITQNFRDYHCFIRTFDPSICMVVLFPQLKTLVKGLGKLDNINVVDKPLFSKMGLMMFECRRQNSVNRVPEPFKLDQIKVLPVNSLLLNESLEGISTDLRPTVSTGLFHDISSEEKISDQSSHLLKDITNIYSRCYVKSIFSCLLHGRAVDSDDFQRVLEICNETNIAIDLTGYLNVQTMLRKQSSLIEEDINEVYQRFTGVLGHYFEPVIISGGKWSNIYCYRPPFAKIGQKLGLSLSLGEKPTNLADVVMCAQSPLFVRLNCTLRKPDSSEKGYTEVQFPLHQLPMSFEGTLEDGTSFNLEPESIGTERSPVESTDNTTATLHLVCITLPPCDYDVVNSEFVHESVCPVDSSVPPQDSLLHTSKDERTKLQGLSKDKLDALLETVARLNWLFTEEIMHGLLRIEPVTENMIHYVEAQLQKKNPFVDFPTTTFIPLAFVKSQKESRQIFLDELELYNNQAYQLTRVGDCFYASDSNPEIINGRKDTDAVFTDVTKNIPFFDGEGLNITTDPALDEECMIEDTAVTESKDEKNDEFCHGLGISIEEAVEDTQAVTNSPDQLAVRPRYYWLLIIPQAQTVQIYFYSKKQQFVNRTEIIRVTRSMINDVLERTNKISLLRNLNETRKCSKYLLATAEEDSSIFSSSEESTDEDEFLNGGASNNLVEILSTSGDDSAFSPPKKFSSGQFACNVVFTKRFPLHWRLAPNTAYNKLMSDVLQPFLVKNVPGMLVCSHDSSVLYCFLSEISPPANNTNLSDSMNLSLSMASIGEDKFNTAQPESPYGASTNLNYNNDETLSNSHTRIRHTAPAHGKPSPQGSINSERHSPRQSPSATADNTAASISSPISNRKSSQRNQEGRELILEVHGVKMNHYIIDGLVDMIESRITSDITLKEVQQFLVRNPNSKLSRADVDFILPVDKTPLIQRQLALPMKFKNTAQFLKIFKRNILAISSLHTLHSNYLKDAIRRHHDRRYNKHNINEIDRVLEEFGGEGGITEDWSFMDLCFYYNFINRAPGTSLPFEQKIGEGIAGICVSVVDKDGIAYSQVSSTLQNNWRDYDMESLHDCLMTDFTNTDDSYNGRIAIDIWSHCKIDVGQIYAYILRSFRQTICDYILETSIMSITNDETSDDDEFASIANILIYTLKTAAEWESSTVKHILQPIHLAPWYLEGITLQLKTELVDIHASLEPLIARAKLPSDLELYCTDDLRTNFYEVYSFGEKSTKSVANRKNLQSKYCHRRATQNYPNTRTALLSQYVKNKKKLMNVPTFDSVNYQFLLLSGLPELLNRYNLLSSATVRNASIDANINPNDKLNIFQGIQQNESNTMQNITTTSVETAKKDDSGSLHSRQESLASSISRALPSHISKQKPVSLREPLHQHSFVIFLIDSHQLRTFTYNCSSQFIDFVQQAMYKNVMHQESRHMALNNILNQKLGLFYHSKKLSDVITRYQNEVRGPMPSTIPNFTPATPLLHNSYSQVQLLNTNSTKIPVSPVIANTFDRLVQLDSSSSVPSFDSLSNDKRNRNDNIFGFDNLQQLITDSFQYRHEAQSKQHKSVLDIRDNAKLCRSNDSDKVFAAVKGADANTLLHDVFADSVEENTNWYDADYLIRHGEPYLKMYLARSKPLAAHEKAFKVYMKWAHKYYGPSSQPSVNNNEMMTVSELRQILKASRLLHFCRTPLIFSSLNSVMSLTITEPAFTAQYETEAVAGLYTGKKPTIPKSEEMTQWYESLADTFLREYAYYLESIGMHLIVYGPSNQDQDEIDAYLSNFTITEEYSVKSPVVYLLQVFEGGSIMCEIRLTGAFVSVTLYTLHRRYGRLQYSPFSYPQKREEIGRENFQLFMSESDRFKHRIHVNSFVYDFHLRYMQRSLDDIDRLPPNLNLLGILKSTVAVYNRPAIYARNRIMTGHYAFSADEALGDIVSWIMKSGSVLGLKTLKFDGVPVSCFISSDNLNFEADHNDNNKDKKGQKQAETSNFRFTLILCPKDGNNKSSSQSGDIVDTYQQGSFDTKGTVMSHEYMANIESRKNEASTVSTSNAKFFLTYFILVTYRGMERDDSCRKAWAKVLKERPITRSNRSSTDEIPTPNATAVKEAARYKIEDIIANAMYYYHREVDWNKLCEVMRPQQLKESAQSIMRVASRFDPINLGEVDVSFKKFLDLKGVNWDDTLDNLKLFYMMTSGEVSVGNTRHVFLFNSEVSNPTFFHFTYTPNGPCTVTFNCKESRSKTTGFTEDEQHTIGNLASCLSYYIWRCLK